MEMGNKSKRGWGYRVAAIAGGLVVGAINGFFGGGGGMLAVPLLQRACGLETKKAHATAILTILPISVISLAVYIIGGHLPIATSAVTAGGVVTGGIIGAVLLSKLPSKVVAIVFAGLMIIAGAKLLFW